MEQVKRRLFALFFIVFLNFESSLQECPNIITKDMWNGKLNMDVEYVLIPIRNVIIQHTATEECEDIISCTKSVKEIQNHHQNNFNFHDIGYNFIIGGKGIIYEGVGWHKVGAHTFGWNKNSLGIAFIGDFSEKLPVRESLAALRKLIECGVENGEIASDYRLFGHRQLRASQSPGTTFYNEIKTWPHFSLNTTKNSY